MHGLFSELGSDTQIKTLSKILVFVMIRILCFLLFFIFSSASLIEVINNVFFGNENVHIQDLNTVVGVGIVQQLKKIIGIAPADDLNLTSFRDNDDDTLFKIIILALIGNFTNSKAGLEGQICSVSMDPRTGQLYFTSNDQNTQNIIALETLIIILCAVLVRNWMKDSKKAE